MKADYRKEKVIEKIKVLSDETILKKIELLLNDNSFEDIQFIQEYVKPIRKITDINALVKEKNYKGINKNELKSITSTINIPQETEELLAMLD